MWQKSRWMYTPFWLQKKGHFPLTKNNVYSLWPQWTSTFFWQVRIFLTTINVYFLLTTNTMHSVDNQEWVVFCQQNRVLIFYDNERVLYFDNKGCACSFDNRGCALSFVNKECIHCFWQWWMCTPFLKQRICTFLWQNRISTLSFDNK